VAILLALIIVNYGLPLGATVIPKGSLPFTALDSAVISPVGEMRAMLPAVVRVNQIEPQVAGAMSSGRRQRGRVSRRWWPG
jgi:hypothetical protein